MGARRCGVGTVCVHGAVLEAYLPTYSTYDTYEATEEEIVGYLRLRPHRVNGQVKRVST